MQIKALEVTNISYMKGVLEEISFTVNKGEIVTILGPNGSGKTSLLKIIAGVIKAHKGEIQYFFDKKIAYMPQHINIDKTFPINGKNFISLSNYKIYKKRLHDLIEIIGVEDLLQQQVSKISGGELQKLLLVRTLATNPNLMILDEPVSSMDIASRESFYEIIRKESVSNNCTVIMSSHDIHVVMSKTNKVICLNHKICCEGEPQHIVNNEKFVMMFGRNLSLYKHYHDNNS